MVTNNNQELTTFSNHPFRRLGFPLYGGKLRLTPQDRLLVAKGGSSAKAIELYLDLLTDDRAFSCFDKQVQTVLSQPWRITPANSSRKAKKIADFVSDVITSLGLAEKDGKDNKAILETDNPFDSLCRSLMVAEITGITTAEVIWGRKNNMPHADSIKSVDIRRFAFEADEENTVFPRLLTKDNAITGDYLPPCKFIFHRCWAISTEDPYGLGLGRLLYYPVTWKREALTYMLLLGNKNANPSIIGEYPRNATPEQKQALNDAIVALGKNMSASMPEGFNIEPFKPNITSSVAYLTKLISYCDSAISLIICGEATTGESGQGQTQQFVNNSIRISKAKAWSERLDATLKATLFSWLVKFAFGEELLPLTPSISRNFTNVAELIAMAKSLSEIGYEIDEEFLARSINVPIARKMSETPVVE